MKKLAIIITLMVITSGLLVAKSSDSGIFMDQVYNEKNPANSVNQRHVMNSEKAKINEDVYLVLSKNSRVLNRSTKYLMQTLNNQINWEYRTIIYSLHKQFGILDYLEMQEQNNKISE